MPAGRRPRRPGAGRRAPRARGRPRASGGHAEDGDHGVADELLDGAAVGLDDRCARRRSSGAGRRRQLGVVALGEGGEADEVAEEGRDDAALLGQGMRFGDPIRLGDRLASRPPRARAAARAEGELGGVLAGAGGAGDHRPRPSTCAPLGPRHRIRFPLAAAPVSFSPWRRRVQKAPNGTAASIASNNGRDVQVRRRSLPSVGLPIDADVPAEHDCPSSVRRARAPLGACAPSPPPSPGTPWSGTGRAGRRSCRRRACRGRRSDSHRGSGPCGA